MGLALAGLVAGVGSASAKVPSTGELRVLAVLASFPDRAIHRERTAFAGAPTALLDRLATYMGTVSSGRLRVVPQLADTVVTLPLPRARYLQRPDGIARDAITAYVATTDEAGRRALETAGAVIVFFAGAGRESHVDGGDPNDPWSNYTDFTPSTHGIGEAIVVAEEEVEPFSNFGVLCHEFGHLLGLPELYAPGGRQNEGIGVWGLMGQGTWLGRGDKPPQMEAWSKVRLGWVDVQTIDRTTPAVEIPAVAEVPRVVKIPAVPDRPQEYYLLEYRRKAGVDERLPGEGLLVWHVDERVGGFRDAQVDVGHKLLHLVEADGRNDLDRGHTRGGNRGDATDPWIGPPAWVGRARALLVVSGAMMLALAVFRVGRAGPGAGVLLRLVGAVAAFAAVWHLQVGPVCGPGTPGMSPYGGEPVGVVLRNVSALGPSMRVDILVAPVPLPAPASAP